MITVLENSFHGWPRNLWKDARIGTRSDAAMNLQLMNGIWEKIYLCKDCTKIMQGPCKVCEVCRFLVHLNEFCLSTFVKFLFWRVGTDKCEQWPFFLTTKETKMMWKKRRRPHWPKIIDFILSYTRIVASIFNSQNTPNKTWSKTTRRGPNSLAKWAIELLLSIDQKAIVSCPDSLSAKIQNKPKITFNLKFRLKYSQCCLWLA